MLETGSFHGASYSVSLALIEHGFPLSSQVVC